MKPQRQLLEFTAMISSKKAAFYLNSAGEWCYGVVGVGGCFAKVLRYIDEKAKVRLKDLTSTDVVPS
ncbi:hypothetical protein IFM89_028384 [Coptis chinensis]|uniref:Uncharacterized protein n=1 Tax=Coptis chinensis TaxID=261450 RepID=A0A835LGR1_9MAGN|nr:hypothetical protein IFM89_028384 [Coptis chinensis]